MKQSQSSDRKVWKGQAMVAALLGLSMLQPAAAFAEVTSGKATDIRAVQNQPAAAPEPQAKITKEQAVEIVKKLFPQLKDAKTNDVHLGDNNSFPPQYQNVWSIQWQFTNGNHSYGFSSSVDSITGDLLQIGLYYYPPQETNQSYYPPKYTRAEVLEKVKAFIRKASPSVSESSLHESSMMIKQGVQPLFGPVRYDFSFSIDINGIKSMGDSLHITVDGNGDVVNYNHAKAAAAYPSAVPAWKEEEAAKKYESAADLSLRYMPIYKDPYSTKNWIIAWVPRDQGALSMDAQSGDFLDAMGNVVNPNDIEYTAVKKTGSGFASVTGTDNGKLTAEQAAKAVEQVVGIPSDRKLSNQYFRSNEPFAEDRDKQVWDLSWTEQKVDRPQPYPRSTRATVDAKTGQILHYSEDSFGPPWMAEQESKNDPNTAISKDQAEEKALKLINVLYPAASEELKLVAPNPNRKNDAKSFNFQYQRFYNDIPVNGDMTSITLDASGKLTSYYSTRSTSQEAAAKGLQAKVSKSDATSLFLNQTKLRLQYSRFGGYYDTNAGYQPLSVKLVYARTNKDERKSDYVMDAVTGEWKATFLGFEGVNGGSEQLPADVTGHWAQKDLATMLQYNILKADDSALLHPDSSITLGDWMNMMAKAVNPHYEAQYSMNDASNQVSFQDVNPKSPYYSAAQFYIQNRWLDPKLTPSLQPEQQLTREVLADNLVRLIKYNKLADHLQNKLPMSFKDEDQIGDSYRGSVSLAVQLGLMTGSDGDLFEPKHTITKAETAVVMMRLVTLQGKLDQGIAY